MSTIHISGRHFVDHQGRTLLLRGVNLGGNSKVPYRPNGATWVREGFFDHRHVSFVGRPFPLAEADEHLSRLRAWGLTFLRFLVTWEAVEHAGPGQYDEEYLDYVRAVAIKAGEHGLSLYIDPHQDVWSRFSGGDGAPGWTLEAAGLDMTAFAETGAAVVHATHGDPLPKMIWPTNESKLATATMFSLFFGGNDFAPRALVAGEPVQEYLQRHYIAAMQQVARRLCDLPHVVGYDTLNEPQAGYIGRRELTSLAGELTTGDSPTPFQAMLLGAGVPQEVEVWKVGLTGVRRAGKRWLNREGRRAWLEGRDCLWRENGVWDLDAAGRPRLLRPDHFSHVRGRAVDFTQDYYRPFARRFAEALRAVHPVAIIFVESEVGCTMPALSPAELPDLVAAPHWYDGYVLVRKEYSSILAADFHTHRVVVGPRAIRRSFAGQMARLQCGCRQGLGDAPVLLGEFGIPFDLYKKRAYRDGDFRAQERALNRSFQAVEANLLSCTLWNYAADNSNARGDLWNDEDFSLFSRDQQKDPLDINSGGRALRAAVRPYPRATAGEPLSLSFDPWRHDFAYTFRHDPAVDAPTEIFLPLLHYPRGCRVDVSDGTYEVDAEGQTLTYRHSLERAEHTVRIRPQ